jgi:phosphohistidine phosphatase SixA
MVVVTLVRHGEAVSKNLGLEDEERDLTEFGIKQIRAISSCLERPSRIFSSPYKRALHTALVLSERLGVEVIAVEWLRPGLFNLNVLFRNIVPGALYVGHNPDIQKTLLELGINAEVGTGDSITINLLEKKVIAHLKPSLCMNCISRV